MNDLTTSEPSWLARHEFLIRRLHSLCGLIPVGAYMVVHLITNASILESASTFQANVYRIHSLGRLLPIVEWGFIFTPILFHAILGVVIIRGGLPNSGTYRTSSNLRYSLQRITGIIAFLFIVWHVFHMHGWFHSAGWLTNVADPLNGANFRPYNAASSVAVALQGTIVTLLYVIGVLSCVFHLANGMWTMGITWGVWISPAAQRRADYVCGAFGIGLAIISMSALYGAKDVNIGDALRSEDKMYKAKVAADEVNPKVGEKKKWSAEKEAELEQEYPVTSPEESDSTSNEQASATRSNSTSNY